MHSLFRENLQGHLISYKKSQKEVGLKILHDARQAHERKKMAKEERALRKLEEAQYLRVAFAVKSNIVYDGALEDESPFQTKTISFKKGEFMHIYMRYDPDWWVGRVVSKGTKLGFIPTAQRLGRMEIVEEESSGVIKVQSAIWECISPYSVVPTTRPIVFLGPAFQNSKITQLMHTALRSEVMKVMGNKVKKICSDIGRKNMSKLTYDTNEAELRLISSTSNDLSLVLLECPNVNVPSDLQGIHIAPIFVFIKVSNRRILVRLMNRTGLKGKGELNGVDTLLATPTQLFDVIIEEKGLPEATKRLCSFLEEYWEATHPTHSLI